MRWIFDFRRGSAESYKQRALESYKQSEPDPAITYYQMALRRASGDPDLAASLGQVYYEKGDLAEAEQHFRSALKSDAKNLRALKGLAFILHEKGDSSAILFYLKCLEVDDKDAVVLANIGLVLANEGQYEEALAYYGRAERIEPNWAKPHELRGAAFYSLLRFQEAADA